MKVFNLVGDIRIRFNGTDAADVLDGYSKRDENFYGQFYEVDGNPLRDVRIEQYSEVFVKSDLGPSVRSHLDIGCGDGLFVEQCRKVKNLESFGIDAHAPTNRGFLMKMSLEDFIQDGRSAGTTKTFDLISLMDVLEHFKDPLAALESVKTLMHGDSRLLIKVPSKNSLIYRIAKFLASWVPGLARGTFARMYQINYPPPHYYYYNLQSLKSLLGRAGFEVQSVGYISETPLKVLHKRLWNISPAKRPFAYIVLFALQCITPPSMYDGLLVVSKLKA